VVDIPIGARGLDPDALVPAARQINAPPSVVRCVELKTVPGKRLRRRIVFTCAGLTNTVSEQTAVTRLVSL